MQQIKAVNDFLLWHKKSECMKQKLNNGKYSLAPYSVKLWSFLLQDARSLWSSCNFKEQGQKRQKKPLNTI